MNRADQLIERLGDDGAPVERGAIEQTDF
jgi:hypothetical protein